VYADLDDRTACISPAAIENLISERTRAIMVVHAYCSIANISEIMRIANARGIPVIEDCSQAHGATWGGQKVGSFGDIAVFSTQQSKLLTSGEGGLVSTNSDELYERLQYSINDGRRVLPDINSRNWMSLGDGGKLPGQNLNASEFTCAILSAQLEILDTQNRIRAESAQFLAEELSKAGVADVLATDERTSFRVYWRLLLKCNEEFVPSHQLEAYSERVSRLAALPVEKVDEPACRNRLLHRASVAFQTVHPAPEGSAMPTALWLHDRILAVPQFALLARRSRLVQLVEAFKVAGKV
jgi:dTDP-4-amino-4,6-dideoxygalactose transaminase